MANELLDFVLSLRDPAVAARYADNPAQTIADAGLTDVTSADVANLIPVVSDSLSTAVPTAGTDAVIGDMAGNVWASGAATAAFDAFDDHVPVQSIDDVPTVAADLADAPGQSLESGLDALADGGMQDIAGIDDPSLQFDGPVIDDVPAEAAHAETAWDETVANVEQLNGDGSGFDVLG
jgi:hypothetical protein